MVGVRPLVRFCVDHRFKPHGPPLEQIPANSVKFQPVPVVLPQVGYLRVNLNLRIASFIPIFYDIDYEGRQPTSIPICSCINVRCL